MRQTEAGPTNCAGDRTRATRHDERIEVNSLPKLVRRYGEPVALGTGPHAARTLRLTQIGEMVLKPGARPRVFTATEEFAVDQVAFSWRATFPMLGPVSMRVTDCYDGNDGTLEVRLLGVPLRRQRGPHLAQGEAYRYLAEIAWMPQAILANPQLNWREVDERTVELSTNVRSEQISVRLIFNEAGEIAETVAERPRLEAGNAVTRWIGEYADYERLEGVLIPTRGEVRWELSDGPFTYWRGTITSLEVHH